MISEHSDRAIRLMHLFEVTIANPYPDHDMRADIAAKLDELCSEAMDADDQFKFARRKLDGCTYADLHLKAFPTINSEAVWVAHLELVAPTISQSAMKKIRREAEKNLGAFRRSLWRKDGVAFLMDQPVSRYCRQITALPATGNKREIKKHAKKQIKLLKILIVALSPLSTAETNDTFTRSTSMCIGNVVRFRWIR